MFLQKDSSVLLVVDMQEKLLPTISRKEDITANIKRLIALAKTMELPIVLTEQYPKGLGKTDSSLAQELGEHYAPIEKMTFSCMGAEAFRKTVYQLRLQGRYQITVSGIEAHVCVYQTVIHLLSEGWDVHIAADGIGSRAEQNWLWALDLMGQSGALIKPTETIMFEMLERAGTPQFKAMMPHFK
jgi:nicotinamidase-related amidase